MPCLCSFAVRILKVCLCLGCGLFWGTSEVSAWTGYVYQVLDGDSIRVRRGKTSVEVRLYGVDAPEYDQPYGSAARKYVTAQIQGKRVTVTPKDTDHYGRTVAWVEGNGKSVNEGLVQNGYAWVYTRYCIDKIRCNTLKKLEWKARRAGRGLWGPGDQIPPWKWKRR